MHSHLGIRPALATLAAVGLLGGAAMTAVVADADPLVPSASATPFPSGPSPSASGPSVSGPSAAAPVAPVSVVPSAAASAAAQASASPSPSASAGSATPTPSVTPSLAPSETPLACSVTEQDITTHWPDAKARPWASGTGWFTGDKLVAATWQGKILIAPCLPR